MRRWAFVLVGGFGSRLRSVVSDVPKPMATVAGRPFLEHLLDYLVAQGVSHIVLCLGYQGQVIRDHFGASYRGHHVLYSIESEPLGTGGALSQALQRFMPDTPFVVTNGDTYFPIHLETLQGGSQELIWSWTLALFRTVETERYGVVNLDNRGYVTGFGAKKHEGSGMESGNFLANSGVWLGNPDNISVPLLHQDRPYSSEEYLALSIDEGRVNAMGKEFQATFIDIGLPEDYVRVQRLNEFSAP